MSNVYKVIHTGLNFNGANSCCFDTVFTALFFAPSKYVKTYIIPVITVAAVAESGEQTVYKAMDAVMNPSNKTQTCEQLPTYFYMLDSTYKPGELYDDVQCLTVLFNRIDDLAHKYGIFRIQSHFSYVHKKSNKLIEKVTAMPIAHNYIILKDTVERTAKQSYKICREADAGDLHIQALPNPPFIVYSIIRAQDWGKQEKTYRLFPIRESLQFTKTVVHLRAIIVLYKLHYTCFVLKKNTWYYYNDLNRYMKLIGPFDIMLSKYAVFIEYNCTSLYYS